MKKFVLATLAALTLGMGVAVAAPSGGSSAFTSNHLPSAPYTYSAAGG